MTTVTLQECLSRRLRGERFRLEWRPKLGEDIPTKDDLVFLQSCEVAEVVYVFTCFIPEAEQVMKSILAESILVAVGVPEMWQQCQSAITFQLEHGLGLLNINIPDENWFSFGPEFLLALQHSETLSSLTGQFTYANNLTEFLQSCSQNASLQNLDIWVDENKFDLAFIPSFLARKREHLSISMETENLTLIQTAYRLACSTPPRTERLPFSLSPWHDGDILLEDQNSRAYQIHHRANLWWEYTWRRRQMLAMLWLEGGILSADVMHELSAMLIPPL